MRFPQVVRDLLAARDIIATRGWQQGALGSADGPCCAMGAVASGVEPGGNPHACKNFDRGTAAMAFIEAALCPGETIPSWNDAPGRTRRDVLSLLDAAASLALSEAAR